MAHWCGHRIAGVVASVSDDIQRPWGGQGATPLPTSSEPTTASLVERVREGIQGDEDDPTMYVQDAYAALTALQSRCEELHMRERANAQAFEDASRRCEELERDRDAWRDQPLPDWQRKFRDCVEMRDAALDREAGTADALQAALARVEELEREKLAVEVELATEAEMHLARAERAEAEVQQLHAAFPIYDSLARAEAEVQRLREALARVANIGYQPGLTAYQNTERVRRAALAALSEEPRT